jgi:hypothetical protein
MIYGRNKKEGSLELYVFREQEGWHAQGYKKRLEKNRHSDRMESQERQRADMEKTSVKQNPTLALFV